MRGKSSNWHLSLLSLRRQIVRHRDLKELEAARHFGEREAIQRHVAHIQLGQALRRSPERAARARNNKTRPRTCIVYHSFNDSRRHTKSGCLSCAPLADSLRRAPSAAPAQRARVAAQPTESRRDRSSWPRPRTTSLAAGRPTARQGECAASWRRGHTDLGRRSTPRVRRPDRRRRRRRRGVKRSRRRRVLVPPLVGEPLPHKRRQKHALSASRRTHRRADAKAQRRLKQTHRE